MKSPAVEYRRTDYRLVTNRDVAPPTAWVRAENALVETLLDAGLTAQVVLSPKHLERHVPDVRGQLRWFDPPQDPVFQTDLTLIEVPPAEAGTLVEALSVDQSADSVPGWRRHGIDRLALVSADHWHYYSVPRKPAVRAVDGLDAERRQTVRDAIADIPCTALFPHGALAAWTVADVAVEITVEGLWLGRADGETRWYPHGELQGVVADQRACELVLSWPTRKEQADSSLGRAVRVLVDRVRESPPRYLHPPTDSLLETATTAYELVADRLCYEFPVRRHESGVESPIGRE